MKTSELTGAALDWAVAKCEEKEVYPDEGYTVFKNIFGEFRYQPTTDWSQGGPIIAREQIAIEPWSPAYPWHAMIAGGDFEEDGPTPLIAAMRCFVASKLGDEVEVPEELT